MDLINNVVNAIDTSYEAEVARAKLARKHTAIKHKFINTQPIKDSQGFTFHLRAKLPSSDTGEFPSMAVSIEKFAVQVDEELKSKWDVDNRFFNRLKELEITTIVPFDHGLKYEVDRLESAVAKETRRGRATHTFINPGTMIPADFMALPKKNLILDAHVPLDEIYVGYIGNSEFDGGVIYAPQIIEHEEEFEIVGHALWFADNFNQYFKRLKKA